MKKMVFVNLPVSDMQRSINFYEALGLNKIRIFLMKMVQE